MLYVHRKLFIYIGVTFLLTLIIDSPKFFEYTWKESSDGYSWKSIRDMRLHPYYVIYYICWARLILLQIIPSIIMVSIFLATVP